MPSRSATCIDYCNRGYALCPHDLPHVLMIVIEAMPSRSAACIDDCNRGYALTICRMY